MAPRKLSRGRSHPPMQPVRMVGGDFEEAKRLAKSGRIRQKFLWYSVEDIFEIDCVESLAHISDRYNPCSQPHNIYEFAYCELILRCIRRRLAALTMQHV